MNNENGEVLATESNIKVKWIKYFEQLLNEKNPSVVVEIQYQIKR